MVQSVLEVADCFFAGVGLCFSLPFPGLKSFFFFHLSGLKERVTLKANVYRLEPESYRELNIGSVHCS